MFYEDLKGETLPQWLFITPNMTNDGHDTSVTFAGRWARNFLTPLLTNEYFMKRTLILVTFDENHSYHHRNRIFSFLLGDAVPDNLVGTKDENYYVRPSFRHRSDGSAANIIRPFKNHYSEISTVEANWDLHTLGRWDVGANVFSMVAKHTGDILRPHTGATGSPATYFYNTSFAGPFNDDFEKALYPAPNLDIKSPKTGRTVLPDIVDTWKDSDLKTYYTDSVVVPDGMNPPPGYKANSKS